MESIIAEYKRMSPGADDADNLADDLGKLIEKELRMFPDVRKVIVLFDRTNK